MKTLSSRETRTALGKIEALVRKEGDVVIARHDRPGARLLPIRKATRLPSNADLRESLPRLAQGSEELIREDRDAR